MNKTKKIALITCASNFERHHNIIHAVQKKIASMKNYALYVFTNYAVFYDGIDYTHGDAAIYSLIDRCDFDGCIIESNLGVEGLVTRLVDKLKARNIPVVTINMQIENVPSLIIQVEQATVKLLDHLIEKHGCRKINLALHTGNQVVATEALETYKKVLEKHGIPYEEKRVFWAPINLPNGRALYKVYKEAGVMDDADAVFCSHDVTAIGLMLELEEHGISVPEDIRICSLNHSGNSIAFRPSITGIDRRDSDVATMACDLIERAINGEEIPLNNTYAGTVSYHASCGCFECDSRPYADMPDYYVDVYRRMVYNKIEAGSQIGGMMRLNNTLEYAESFEQLSEAVHNMINGLGCRSFFFCMNTDDIAYIESSSLNPKKQTDMPYSDEMTVVTGYSERTGRIRDLNVNIKDSVPFSPKAGDMLILMPVHYLQRDYGFVAFLNESLPIDVYNYRICHEGIGSSIENLHRHIVMKNTVSELDRLHMQDQMTGLYNRFALGRFREDFVSDAGYSVALFDMDGLKAINDVYGHLAGNNALCIAADSIRMIFGEECVSIRYGGDEFLVLSKFTEPEIWEEKRQKLNRKLNRTSRVQKLPFEVGLSMGYAISLPHKTLRLEQCIEDADRAMYEDKKARKATRYTLKPLE